MHWKKILPATVLGSLVGFAWGFVSHVVLPWHHATMDGLSNEAEVAALLAEGADDHGIYSLPWADSDMAMEGPEADEWRERHERGPIAFLSVHPAGLVPMAPSVLAAGLLLYAFGALLLALLLSATRPTTYARRVLFAAVAGGFAGLSELFYLNYWYFPTDYALVNFVDAIVTWTLVGLVVAAFVKPQPATP